MSDVAFCCCFEILTVRFFLVKKLGAIVVAQFERVHVLFSLFIFSICLLFRVWVTCFFIYDVCIFVYIYIVLFSFVLNFTGFRLSMLKICYADLTSAYVIKKHFVGSTWEAWIANFMLRFASYHSQSAPWQLLPQLCIFIFYYGCFCRMVMLFDVDHFLHVFFLPFCCLWWYPVFIILFIILFYFLFFQFLIFFLNQFMAENDFCVSAIFHPFRPSVIHVIFMNLSGVLCGLLSVWCALYVFQWVTNQPKWEKLQLRSSPFSGIFIDTILPLGHLFHTLQAKFSLHFVMDMCTYVRESMFV